MMLLPASVRVVKFAFELNMIQLLLRTIRQLKIDRNVQKSKQQTLNGH